MTPSRIPGGLSPSSSDEELLNDLLDGRLGAAETRALEARLEREPLLREGYDELLRTRELFRAAPDPEPPADFTARVRARLEAELAASPPPAKQAGQLELAPGLAPGPAPGLVPEPALSSVPEVPRVWRRLMVTAYAAAALLMVGIGVVSLQRGSKSETNAGHAPAIETARGAAGEERGGWDLEESKAPGQPSGKKAVADDAKLAAPLLPGVLEAEREKTMRVGETAATGGAAGRGAPRLGPGGGVRPGLREPSDMAPAPPAAAASAPELAAAPPSEPLPAEPLPAELLPAELVATEPLASVLLLEARTAVEGRALVAQVLAGPSARAADADEAPTGFTRVLLRRADARADGVLLASLRVALPAKDGALPDPAAAPAAPSAAPPTTPPVSGPARVPAAGAAAPVPTVLADFWQDLDAEQQARLEALLGPLPASGPVPTGGGGAAPASAPSVPRRVRIVITAPSRTSSGQTPPR